MDELYLVGQDIETFFGSFFCTPDTKDKITTFLLSVGKSNLKQLNATESRALLLVVEPKCSHGDIITGIFDFFKDLSCESNRASGAHCNGIKAGEIHAQCKPNPCGSKRYCMNCAFWGE